MYRWCSFPFLLWSSCRCPPKSDLGVVAHDLAGSALVSPSQCSSCNNCDNLMGGKQWHRWNLFFNWNTTFFIYRWDRLSDFRSQSRFSEDNDPGCHQVTPQAVKWINARIPTSFPGLDEYLDFSFLQPLFKDDLLESSFVQQSVCMYVCVFSVHLHFDFQSEWFL